MNNTARKIEPVSKNELVDLGVSDTAIAEIGGRYKNLVISDTKTFEATKAARTHVVSLRTGVDKERKLANQGYRDCIAINDEEAKRLTALISKVEQPLQETVRAWENKKAEEKAEKERLEFLRVESHRATIQLIMSLGNVPYGSTEEVIQSQMDALNNIIVDDSLEEFEVEAATTKSTAIFMVESALQGAQEQARQDEERRVEKERLAKERKELEAKQVEIDAENLRIKKEQECEQKKLLEDREQIEADKKSALKVQEDEAI